jgi:sugar phosphate isomerase/epimerase
MFASWNARAVGLEMPARETIETAARVGFRGVDLLVRDLVQSGVDPDELRRRMDDLGIQGGAWPLPVNWRGSEDQFWGDLRELARHARVAARLGLTRTGTWVLPECAIGGADPRGTEDAFRRTLDLHRHRLGRIATILGDEGIHLGLEIIGPAGARGSSAFPFVHHYADLAETFRDFRRERANVGMLVDSFHLYAAGEDPSAGLLWGIDGVVWVHLADSANPDRSSLEDRQRALPGETGLAPCRSLLEQLLEKGYAGPITAEPLTRCSSLDGVEPMEAARRTRAAIDSVWPRAIPRRR